MSTMGGSGRLRRRGALERWEERLGPNMTPMVDIVLVILIFFMAGTTFVSREWFLRSEMLGKARVPTAATMELPPVTLRITLQVGPSGGVTFAGLTPAGSGDEPMRDIGQLREALGAFAKGTDAEKIIVVLVPTAEVPYKHVVAAHAACNEAGIRRVGVSAP